MFDRTCEWAHHRRDPARALTRNRTPEPSASASRRRSAADHTNPRSVSDAGYRGAMSARRLGAGHRNYSEQRVRSTRTTAYENSVIVREATGRSARTVDTSTSIPAADLPISSASMWNSASTASKRKTRKRTLIGFAMRFDSAPSLAGGRRLPSDTALSRCARR